MLNFIKIITYICLIQILFFNSFIVAEESDFNSWLSSYKKYALDKGISPETIRVVFKNVKFLDLVIKYDRKQPEFYEDTTTYVNKRANNQRLNTLHKCLQM